MKPWRDVKASAMKTSQKNMLQIHSSKILLVIAKDYVKCQKSSLHRASSSR